VRDQIAYIRAKNNSNSTMNNRFDTSPHLINPTTLQQHQPSLDSTQFKRLEPLRNTGPINFGVLGHAANTANINMPHFKGKNDREPVNFRVDKTMAAASPTYSQPALPRESFSINNGGGGPLIPSTQATQCFTGACFHGANGRAGPSVSQPALSGGFSNGDNGGAGLSFQAPQATQRPTDASFYGPHNPAVASFQPTQATQRAPAGNMGPMSVCVKAHCPAPIDHVMPRCPKPSAHGGATVEDYELYWMTVAKAHCIQELAVALDMAIAHSNDAEHVSKLRAIKNKVITLLENVGAEVVLPPTWVQRYDVN